MASKIINCDLDAWFANTGGGSGNGKGDRMAVGMGTGDWAWQNRFAIRLPRPAEMAGIPSAASITAFDVSLRVSNALFGIGSAVQFYLERGTTAFIENSENRREWVTSVGGATGEWPGPTRDAANRGSYTGTPANNDWIKVSLLALGQWWFAHPEVTSLVLVGVGNDESTTTRRLVFHTRESTSASYAELVWTDNLAPNIPTDLSPEDTAKASSAGGTQATVTGRHTDPDGDSATKYQAQWFATSVTDATADASTAISDSVVDATTAHNALRSHTFAGLAARTAGKWRLRFFDGVWGAWSLLRTATTAYKPEAVNRAVEPGTATPKLYASIGSQDSADFITAVREIVYQDTPQGTITKWDSGKVVVGGSPTRSEATYGGTPIVFGQPYRRQTQIWNRDDVASDLTANQQFTQYEAVGAIIKIGSSAGPLADPATKINTLTPTFNLAPIGGGNIDQIRFRAYSKLTGAQLYDSGVVDFTAAANRDVTIPASAALAWGTDLAIEGAVRISGNANLGAFSERKTVHLNVPPGTPSPLSAKHASEQVVQRADGVWVTSSATPTLVFPFRDTDRDLGYIDNPTRREIELWRTSTGLQVGASPYVITTGITDEWAIPAAVLLVENMYHAHARYDDSANVRSAWSDLIFFVYSAAPTLSAVTPANGPITDPTPTVGWTFASSGGKAQGVYRIVVRQGTTQLHNSGPLSNGASTYTIPPGLPNGATLTITLTVEDTDGLFASVVRTVTTSFTQPAALTGLTVTDDDDAKALLIAWTASALPDAEFYAYYVYAKPAGGQFRLVKTITTKTETSLLYRYAVHNAESVIRVTQSNGWMESVPTEASETLGGVDTGHFPGYWDVGTDGAYELLHISDPTGDTQTQIEQLRPLSRSDKLLLDWGTTRFEGSFRLFADDRDLVNRLRTWKETGAVRLLKFPYGVSRFVRYVSTPATDRPARWIDQQVTFVEVDPSAADFE